VMYCPHMCGFGSYSSIEVRQTLSKRNLQYLTEHLDCSLAKKLNSL
jgi:hypothetical protein